MMKRVWMVCLLILAICAFTTFTMAEQSNSQISSAVNGGASTEKESMEEIPLWTEDMEQAQKEGSALDQQEDTISKENGGIAIDSNSFPDNTFRDHIAKNYDKDKDGFLSDTEREKVTTMLVSSQKLTSLKGVEFFGNLSVLDCHNNLLTSLDVSKNVNLTSLNCASNVLDNVFVGQLAMLRKLVCYDNRIRKLNVGHNPNLIYLDCKGNKINDLYLGTNDCLETLICFSNKLTELHVSKCKNLKEIQCQKNGLAHLNIRNCVFLSKLMVYKNSIDRIDIGNCALLLRYLESIPSVSSTQVTWGGKLKIDSGTKLTSGSQILYQAGRPTSISFAKSNLTIEVGEVIVLDAKLKPQGVLTNLTWKSSNKNVAIVSDTGVVTGIKKGTATISVITTNGKKATCKISVKSSTKQVELSGYINKNIYKVAKEFGVDVLPQKEGKAIAIGQSCDMIAYEEWEIITQIILHSASQYVLEGIKPGMNKNDAITILQGKGWEMLVYGNETCRFERNPSDNYCLELTIVYSNDQITYIEETNVDAYS